jgi:hypothetical protein
MKTSNQFKKISAFLSIIIGLAGCSKSDSNENNDNNNQSSFYKVPVTITFKGQTLNSNISVLNGVLNNNCDGIGWTANTERNATCYFELNSFNPNGGAVNGGMNSCDRPNVELTKNLDATCYSKLDDDGTLVLSGKTYMLRCNTYIREDIDANGNLDGILAEVKYPFTAVWTKP